MLLFLWSCSDSGEPLGNDCSEELDCNSVCGGSAVVDACGVCDGDDSTCTGCTDENANNYDNTATISCSDDNGDSTPDCCAYGVDIAGCTNSGTCNFNAEATLDDGTCWTPTDGCACTDVQGAVVDDCGVCDGDSSTCNISYSQIQEIFNENCANCHISSTRNNLSLSNYANIMLGDSENGPVIDDTGDHTISLLWQYVNSGFMPPGNSNLTASQINLIATWIDEGAEDN